MTTSAVFTTLYRELYADATINPLALVDDLELSYCKYGCAGLPTGNPMPVALATYSDIQALGGAVCPLPTGWPTAGGSAPSAEGSSWYYCKPFAGGQVSVTGSVVTIICLLGGTEANDSGAGDPPSLYELGIFDKKDNLMIYVATSEVIKASGHAVQWTITLTI